MAEEYKEGDVVAFDGQFKTEESEIVRYANGELGFKGHELLLSEYSGEIRTIEKS